MLYDSVEFDTMPFVVAVGVIDAKQVPIDDQNDDGTGTKHWVVLVSKDGVYGEFDFIAVD